MTNSITTDSKKPLRWRTVTAVGAATWLVTTQMSGCASALDGAEGEGERAQAVLHGEGGEGHGEGEGGEGEGLPLQQAEVEGEGEGARIDANALATNDVAYLTQLGLIRGHLAVGYELYRQELPALAATHMKHPQAEIYANVVPAFAARGCDGFGEGLSDLTAAVTGRKPQREVDAVYADLQAGIAVCERVANIDDAYTITKVIENLLRTAGIEYRLGIVEGAVSNLHEYQDAWGFTQTAAAWARSPAFAGDASATAVAGRLQDLIDGLQPLWPSLNPLQNIEGDAAQLFGAAGQVEVTALSLKR